MNNAQRDIHRKKRALEHAVRVGNMRKTCRYFGVSRAAISLWKRAYGDANAYLTRNLHVMHFEENGGLNWIDAAGYLVATSPRPREWPPEPHRFHFQLDVESASVCGSPYLQHQ